MKDTTTETSVTEFDTTEWSIESIKKDNTTVIDANKQYKKDVKSKDKAKEAIRVYGERQREYYDNPDVEAIELKMQQEYSLLAVNLGEIEVETAQDIYEAFSYMYGRYPVLKGSLTNITLGNFESEKSTYIAVTRNREFMMKDFGEYPFVVKYEIILNAAKFMNRKQLIKDCDNLVKAKQWLPDSNITSIVVHELGHQLGNIYAMCQCGLSDAYYITEENGEAYSRYVTDLLNTNQQYPQMILEEAYGIWQTKYGNTGSLEQFRCDISRYGAGVQTDGGISYSEMIAEAMVDIFLNGDRATDASKSIEAILYESTTQQ